MPQHFWGFFLPSSKFKAQKYVTERYKISQEYYIIPGGGPGDFSYDTFTFHTFIFSLIVIQYSKKTHWNILDPSMGSRGQETVTF